MAGYCTVEVEQLSLASKPKTTLFAEATVIVTVRAFNGFKGNVTLVYEGIPTPSYIAPDTQAIYIPQDGSKVQTILVGHTGNLTFIATCTWNSGSADGSTEII